MQIPPPSHGEGSSTEERQVVTLEDAGAAPVLLPNQERPMAAGSFTSLRHRNAWEGKSQAYAPVCPKDAQPLNMGVILRTKEAPPL